MSNITLLGVDLAKSVFQLHGVDKKGNKVLADRLTRQKFIEHMAKMPACTVAIEACGGAHYWVRKLSGFGHEVKMLAPQFVKPYVKSNKTDEHDAEAIAEAASRPSMRFVPNKTIEQQDMQSILRIRELRIKERTAQANQIRGLLSEYGIVLPKGITHLRKRLPSVLEDTNHELSAFMRQEFTNLYERLVELDNAIKAYDKTIARISEENEHCKRLLALEGVGPLSAVALVAAVGDGRAFASGREMSAYLGLVPRQCSSGHRTKLLGISKRGDKYLRYLLIHGGRACVKAALNRDTHRLSHWVQNKVARSNHNKTAVAVANRNVRVAWALLSRKEDYRQLA